MIYIDTYNPRSTKYSVYIERVSHEGRQAPFNMTLSLSCTRYYVESEHISYHTGGSTRTSPPLQRKKKYLEQQYHTGQQQYCTAAVYRPTHHIHTWNHISYSSSTPEYMCMHKNNAPEYWSTAVYIYCCILLYRSRGVKKHLFQARLKT